MNHYEKLRTICHENLIGSEKCWGCDGQKMQSKQHHDGDWEDRDCPTCKGAGYTIPLEFGCEIKAILREEIYDAIAGVSSYQEKKGVYVGEIDGICKVTHKTTKEKTISFTCHGKKRTESILMVTETLGKPLTLQDILRLLDTKQNYGTSKVLRTNGELRGVSEIGGGQIKEILFDIDLTKSIKDQDPEALQAIYEVVK